MNQNSSAEPRCSVARSLQVVGEKWSLLIVRDAVWGSTRFSEFKEALGVSSDVLTDRLATLVDAGIMERRTYREEGSRERTSYHLTEAGEALRVVLAAFNTWGDAYRPSGFGPATLYREAATGEEVSLGFVTAGGRPVARERVEVLRGPGSLLASA